HDRTHEMSLDVVFAHRLGPAQIQYGWRRPWLHQYRDAESERGRRHCAQGNEEPPGGPGGHIAEGDRFAQALAHPANRPEATISDGQSPASSRTWFRSAEEIADQPVGSCAWIWTTPPPGSGYRSGTSTVCTGSPATGRRLRCPPRPTRPRSSTGSRCVR